MIHEITNTLGEEEGTEKEEIARESWSLTTT